MCVFMETEIVTLAEREQGNVVLLKFKKKTFKSELTVDISSIHHQWNVQNVSGTNIKQINIRLVGHSDDQNPRCQCTLMPRLNNL